MAKRKVKVELKAAAAEPPAGDVNISYKGTRLAGLTESATAVLETKDTIVTDNIEVEYSGAGGGSGLTDDIKDALLDCFAHVAWIDDQGQLYYNELLDALYPLQSIEAVFTQGANVIYDTDSLDVLKQYLVVTATFENSETQIINDYTLSGTLTVGTSTITVLYKGKTTTFTVLVTQNPMPSGYITDGLVMFLDGNQVESADSWTDVAGGKTFSLTNCTLNQNGGVVFDGTAYGTHAGSISTNSQNETIEVVLKDFDTSALSSNAFFSQPVSNSQTGIGLRFGAGADNTTRFCVSQVGAAKPLKRAANSYITSTVRMSATEENIVINGTSRTQSEIDNSYAANNTSDTYLGARTTDGTSTVGNIKGTLLAVRIYNRKLTVAEMQANQQRDAAYYSLS